MSRFEEETARFTISVSDLWNSLEPSPSRVARIPPLALPIEAPLQETESDSVQMLRKLLADREGERRRIQEARDSRLRQADEAEKRAAELRQRAATDDSHLVFVDAAIAGIQHDIDTLRGIVTPPSGPHNG